MSDKIEIESVEVVDENSPKQKKEHPTAKKVGIACAILIILVLLGFTFCLQTPSSFVGASNYTDHSRFFRDSVATNANLATKPLTELSILGSHDTYTSDITKSSKANTNESDNIVNNRFVKYFASGLIVRLSKAQDDNVYDQLKSGVRYIDSRITCIDGEYYNCHGVISNYLKSTLELTIKFLYENPGEFIIYNVHQYFKGSSDWNSLYSYMSSVKYNETSIFDYVNYDSTYTDYKDLNYNIITNNGTKAGVVMMTTISDCDNSHFNQLGYNYYNKCNSDINSEQLITKMREKAVQGRSLGSSYLRFNQAQTTPSYDKIWESFTSWALLSKAVSHNKLIVELSDIEQILDDLPIIQFDYVSYNGNKFNDNIISLLSKRNNNL